MHNKLGYSSDNKLPTVANSAALKIWTWE